MVSSPHSIGCDRVIHLPSITVMKELNATVLKQKEKHRERNNLSIWEVLFALWACALNTACPVKSM